MKILRFDSVGGASGDMILNALLELCELNGISQEEVEGPLHRLIPEHFHLRRFEKGSHGMFGKTLVVDIHEHEHEHEHDKEHEYHHEHEHEHAYGCGHSHEHEHARRSHQSTQQNHSQRG
ncbi:MAG: DUF111 family protein [Planctomycetia bacterium]|nr:DUF111 family protein [Planctomycetia bacterium]